MIVLDTNVVSELMRRKPDPHVVGWVDQQDANTTFVTATTVAELFYGVARLPDGKRKRELTGRAEATVTEDFKQRILPFDDVAARHCADIVVHRERAGRPISTAAAEIASICRSHGAGLATRNVIDFNDTGITVTNPWSS